MANEEEARNIRTVKALYAATGTGDWSAAEAMLTEDFQITEAGTLPFGGVYRGRRALRELFLKVIAGSGVTDLEIQHITAGGDTVVVLLDLVLGGSPGVRVPVAEVFQCRDGKICEIKPYYFDPGPMCAAVAARQS